jgi:hypothetical protein
LVSEQFLLTGFEKFGGRTATYRLQPEAPCWIGVPARKITGRRACWVGEDNDRKLKPFGSVYRHHPNTLCALLNDGRIFCLTGFGVGFHALDESPERGGAALLESARQVNHAQAVGQRLLASRPHRNAGVCPNRVEQHQYGLGDGTVVPPHVEAAQQSKCIGYLPCSRIELCSVHRIHGMQPTQLKLTIGAQSLPIHEQSIVAERK